MWSGISSGAPQPPAQWAVSAPQPTQQQQQQQQQKHDIFVGNLAFSTTEEHLHQAFSEIGRIIKVRMVTDLETGKPRGFAFIEFEDPQAALSAIRNMNDYELNGRRIRVNFSNSSHLETMAEKLGMKMSHANNSQAKKAAGGVNSAGAAGVIGAGGITQDGITGSLTTSGVAATVGNETGSQAIANALKGMSRGEMYDIIKKLKEIAESDPDEARKLISGHPQLPEAILFLMGKLDMIKTPVSTNVLDIVSNTATPSTTVAPPPPSTTRPLPPPDAPPPMGHVPPRTDPRQDPRAASKTASATTVAPPAPTTSSRPADPRARGGDPRAADPRTAARPPPVVAVPAAPQQPQPVQPPPQQQQPPPQQPPLPVMMPPHHMQGQIPPPTMAPPPLPFGMVPPPGNAVAPPPAVANSGVAGLDPKLVQEVMRLTQQQIDQLPLDKQQGILALRRQIINSMG